MDWVDRAIGAVGSEQWQAMAEERNRGLTAEYNLGGDREMDGAFDAVMPNVTSTYRYKRPPRKRAKVAAIEAPAIVTIDPKTRVAKKGRRPAFR